MGEDAGSYGNVKTDMKLDEACVVDVSALIFNP
jgi:hypothetical protein